MLTQEVNKQCQEIVVKICNRRGLHARAAARFAEHSEHFQSQIHVSLEGRQVCGRSIMGLMTLGAAQGTYITITVCGDDAALALASLSRLVTDGFGEEI